LLGCLGFGGLIGGGLLWRNRSNRWRSGFTIQLITPRSAEGDPAFFKGLHWVIQAHLAALAPACVVLVPNAETPLPKKPGSFQLQLLPTRQENRLSLGFRWRRAGGGWTERPGKPELPALAVADFLAALPATFALDSKARLLPRSPETAWELFELASNPPNQFRSTEMRDRLERMTALAPECALVWCLLGSAANQEILARNDWKPEDRALAESCLRRALELMPGLPLAAGELAQMFSDFGENRAALEVLARAIRMHPHSEVLLRRLAYSARNAGLLDLAGEAIRARETWMGRLFGIENALLYAGEIDRFEAGLLAEAQAVASEPAHRFYLGYAALARGDRNEALRRLRKDKEAWSDSRFGQIGFSLWAFLEGRTQDSLASLEKLVQQHLSLRSPDGEFVVKLAELMTLHGHEHRAVDLATRAASHGFGCVRWYEQSPFLAPIQKSLRFQALLHTLRDRQEAMADRFPASAFGF
jgi:tetratricopeptide (TPR) repeat protein